MVTLIRPPSKWVETDAMGPGTVFRFIPFKTPLRTSYLKASKKTADCEKVFSCANLMERVESMGLKMGLVLNLCQTEKYYHPSELVSLQTSSSPVSAVPYKRINDPKKSGVPCNEFFNNFVFEVKNFLKKNPSEDVLIGVHCTTGIDKAGFVICKYLIRYEGWDPEDAIKQFTEARGYSMSDVCISQLKQLVPTKKSKAPKLVKPEEKPRFKRAAPEDSTEQMEVDGVEKKRKKRTAAEKRRLQRKRNHRRQEAYAKVRNDPSTQLFKDKMELRHLKALRKKRSARNRSARTEMLMEELEKNRLKKVGGTSHFQNMNHIVNVEMGQDFDED